MLSNDVARRLNLNSSNHANFQSEKKIYHKAGSLLPFLDGQHKFLQMYFIGDRNDKLNTRWKRWISLCRRTSAEDGGKLATIQMRNGDIEVDNHWVVPYSLQLSKTYKS